MKFENISNEDQLKQIKTKICFRNINNDSFLEKVFAYMKKNKSLNIMKYNQKLQKRLNLSINDYKEYSQLYTPIEIELKPLENKYGKFINVCDKEKEYYHIYFDNSNEEVKRNYLNENENIESIKIIIDYNVKSLKGLFRYCFCNEIIIFKKFYRNKITDMSDMFEYDQQIKQIDFSSFKTDNVTNMSLMFFSCLSLKGFKKISLYFVEKI